MKLWEISEKIEACIDAGTDRETGEISEEALDAVAELDGDRIEKALHVAAYAKGERCEAEAVKREAKKLVERSRIHERRAEKLLAYIAQHVEPGTKASDARVEIRWRASEAVEADPERLPEEFLRVSVQADKTALKKALKSGRAVPGAALLKRQTLSVR